MSKEKEFSVAELRQLSAAAGHTGPWLYETATDVLYAPDDGEGSPPIAEVESVSTAALIAYLGTHRERIIAMLVAADMLTEAVHSCEGLAVAGGNGAEAQGRAIRSTCEAYLAAKGGAK